MTNMYWRVPMAAAAVTFGLFWSGDMAPNRQPDLISSAQARIGRPATPMSYAGVARRTTRRAVAAGAAATGAAYYYAPGCVQTTDAYGRIYNRCP
jgi:hypothetical protein